MATALQIVSSDLATTLFDFNLSTGTGNPGSLKTWLLSDFDLGVPPVEREVFEHSRPGGIVVYRRHGLAVTSFRMRANATSYDNAVIGVNELARLLDVGGVLKWIPDGSAETRYMDFESGQPVASLLRGQDLALYKVLRLFDTPEGIPISILRQPYLRGAERDPATNKLTNACLILDLDADGDPNGWTIRAGTHSIVATDTEPYLGAGKVAYQNVHTTGADVLDQDEAASSGQQYTFSAYARRTAGAGTGRLRLSSVGGAATGDSADITSSTWTRYSVTVTMDASTTAARGILRLHSAAASTTLQFRDAQLELAASASVFRVGVETLGNEPAA